jgi:hypothetical protein
MAERTEFVTLISHALEKQCDECDGLGHDDDEFDESRFVCDICDGTGYVLTDAGREVFDFVQHTIQRLRFRSRLLRSSV